MRDRVGQTSNQDLRPQPAVVRGLLRWFARAARPLPWRATRDPYAIWVSEIMLQQTQVQTVIPYWQRWMQTLPDVAALAAAPEELVLKLWEGLGYYRRARHLQQAAKIIMAQHGGDFPQSLEQLLRLPGIGRYTAGAILSIAFNQPAPVLDGNVERVLCRFHYLQENPRQPAMQRRLWRLAEGWVQAAAEAGRRLPVARACSAINQALMEVGAMVCLPRQPQCQLCPLRHHCRAHLAGEADRLPVRAARARITRRTFIVLVAERHGRFLVRRRPPGGLHGGLWEFPNFEVPVNRPPDGHGQATPTLLAAAVRRHLQLEVSDLRPWQTVQQSVTRHRFELRAWRACAMASGAGAVGGRWVAQTDLEHLPMSAGHRRLARALADG